MTRENFITIVSEINHKFKLYSNEKSVDKLHFDIMHMTLIETINGFPKETWAKMPQYIVNTVSRLEKSIYSYTSYEYQQDMKKDNEKSIETQKEAKPQQPKKPDAVKHKIGFDYESLEL